MQRNPLRQYLDQHLAGVVPPASAPSSTLMTNQPPGATTPGAPFAQGGIQQGALIARMAQRVAERQAAREAEAARIDRAVQERNQRRSTIDMMNEQVARVAAQTRQVNPGSPQIDPRIATVVSAAGLGQQPRAQVDPNVAPPVIVDTNPQAAARWGELSPEHQAYLLAQAEQITAQRPEMPAPGEGGNSLLSEAAPAVANAASTYVQGIGTAVGEVGRQIVLNQAGVARPPATSNPEMVANAWSDQTETAFPEAALGVVGAVGNVPGVNVLYEKNVGMVGDLAYERASGKSDQWRDWRQYNPFQYADSGFTQWSANAANKQAIINAHEQGIDTDGDGTSDVTGGAAVYATYLRSLPQDQGLWSGENSLISQIIRAAALDPLTYAAFVSGGSGGLVKALEQKAATTGGKLSTMETILRWVAKGAEAATTVPNAVADAPFTAIGGLGRNLGSGIERATGTNPARLFAPSAAARETTELENVADALMAKQNDPAAVTYPATAAEEAQAIQGRTRVPDVAARPVPAPVVLDPTGGDEARLIQQRAAYPTTRPGRVWQKADTTPGGHDIERAVDPNDTTGLTNAFGGVEGEIVGGAFKIKQRGIGGPWEVTRLGSSEVVASFPTEPPLSQGGRAIQPGRVNAISFVDRQLADALPHPADEARTIQQGARLPEVRQEAAPSTGQVSPVAGTGKFERQQVSGGQNPAYVIRDPDGNVVETIERGPGVAYPGAEAFKRVRDLNADLPTRPLPSAEGGVDPLRGHWIDPKTGRQTDPRLRGRSLYEHVDQDLRQANPEMAAEFDRRYRSDPRLAEFQQKMRAFDQSPEKQALRDAGVSGKALDSADQVLEGIRHRVEVQSPIYREVTGAEPPPFRFDHGATIDEAVPPIDRRGKGGSRPTRRANEKGIVERAVYGTDDEARRAREWMHIQAGRPDLPPQVQQRYRDMLSETTRLRSIDRQGAGGQRPLPEAAAAEAAGSATDATRALPEEPISPSTATPPVTEDAVAELTPEERRAAELASGQTDMFGMEAAAPVQPETALPPAPQPAPSLRETPTFTAPAGMRASSSVIDVDPAAVQVDAKNFQPRSQRYHKVGLSEEAVDEIVRNFDANKFDPIKVWRRPDDGAFVVLSGHHRLEAARRLGLEGIPATVVEGDLQTAQRIARQSNSITTLKPTEYGNAVRAEMAEGRSWKEATGIHKLKSADAKRYVSVSHLPENLQELVDGGQLPINQGAVLGDAVRDGTITPADAQLFHERQMLQRPYTASQLEDIFNGLRYGKREAATATDMFSGLDLGGSSAAQTSALFSTYEELGRELRDAKKAQLNARNLQKSGMVDTAELAQLATIERRIEERIDTLMTKLGQGKPPKGAMSGQGPNLAGLIFDAIDALPQPNLRMADEVAAIGAHSELDDLFNTGVITADQHAILSRPLTIGGEPMTLAELSDRNTLLYGEREGRERTLEQYRALTFGKERPGGWKGLPMKALRVWDTAANVAREGVQYNLATGIRGPLLDAVSDGYTLITTGHGGAAAAQFDPRGVRRSLAVVRGADPMILNDIPDFAAMRQAGSLLPAEYMPSAGRSDTPSGVELAGAANDWQSREMTLHRGVLKVTGGHGRRFTGAITGVLANRTIRDLRNAMDLQRRIALHVDEWVKQHAQGLSAFNHRLNTRAVQAGVNPADWRSAIAETAQRRVEAESGSWAGTFSPEDVRMATGSADLARSWREELRKIDEGSKREVSRALFSYKKSNADAAAGRLTWFHYYMSRSMALHTRTALKNPVLLANYARTWEMLKERSEQEGYPPSLDGYIRFMGDSALGWSSLIDPVGIFVPFRTFMEAASDEDRPAWEKVGLFLNPWIEGGLAAFGLSESVPDVTGTTTVRNAIRAALDWGNAHGMDRLPGGDAPAEDFVRRVESSVYNAANDVLRGLRLTTKDYQPYNQRAGQIVQLRDRVEQIAEDELGPRSMWTPDQRDAVTEAKIKVETGASGGPTLADELAEQAWKDYTDAQGGTRLAGFVAPGVRTVNADLNRRREQAGEFYDSLAAGTDATSEQREAANAMAEANAGTPEVLRLQTENEGYHAIGTERQQALSQGWSNIAYGKDLAQGYYEIGGRTYFTDALMAMDEETRKVLANQWVRDHGGAKELREYRDERDAYIAAHPEYQGFDTYTDSVRQFEGGARAFRTRAEQDHPEFADEISKKRETFRKQGKTGAVLENELDNWADSIDAYNAFQGVRNSIYDDDPKPTYDPTKDPYGGSWSMGAGSSEGSGSSEPRYDKASALKKALAEYEIGMQIASDQIGEDASRLNAYVAQGYRNLGIIPEMGDGLRNYFAWAAKQQRGADTSIDAYVAYLEEQEDGYGVAS